MLVPTKAQGANAVATSSTTPTATIKAPPTGINSLFRFLFISSPQTGDIENDNISVINPPVGATSKPTSSTSSSTPTIGISDIKPSFFMVGSQGSRNDESARKKGGEVTGGFVPFSSYLEPLDINRPLFELGKWMKGVSSDTSAKELSEKKQSAKPLTLDNEYLLWNNLVYQLQDDSATNAKMVDAIILMLRANAFLKELSNLNLREELTSKTVDKLTKAANAYVSVPSHLVALPKKWSPDTAPFVDAETQKCLMRYSNLDIAKYKIRQLRANISELETANKAYQLQESAAFEIANRRYREQIDGILGTNVASDAQARGESSEEVNQQRIAALERLAPGTKLPTFDYQASDPLDENFIAKNLSAKSAKVLRYYRNVAAKSITDVIATMETELGTQYKILINNQDTRPIAFYYKGVSIAANNSPANNSYIIRAVCVDDVKNLYSLFITQYFDNANYQFSKVILNAKGKKSMADYTCTSIAAINENDNYATFQFFEEGIPNEEYELEVSYDSINNQSGDFGQPQFLMDEINTGVGSGPTAPKGPIDSYNDGEPGNKEVTLYGVAKVGIGDFMRVEQEVCCYVPGEVSHIENIMAREYKEKASRELTRVETITEETTEREEERLKDTVSTERHELNSEIARVIQQDKSLSGGANASVTGDMGNVQISASGNFNSTNSSSLNNSFSQAEAYAKDVVERAMERIVEKMTYKRTSRMLREFEETNKHGFDNREGTEHVTGIYRWVDKVYENRVMNYGKRLIYNFVVPEPSSNWKRWIKGKYSTDLSSLPPEPVAPEALGIGGAKNIDRGNYADYAAKYGAEIEPCPVGQMNVGGGFGETLLDDTSSIRTGGAASNVKHWAAGYKYEIEIPEGYYCNSADIESAHEVQDENADGHCGLWVSVGADQWWEERDFKKLNWPQPTNIYKKLSISVSAVGVSVFNLNVIAKCLLDDEVFQAWQATAYMKIVQAYHKKVQEYNDALAEYNALADIAKKANDAGNQTLDYSLNPIEARAIEQRELKRACIELMMLPFGLFDINYGLPDAAIGMGHLKQNVYGNLDIQRKPRLTTHAKYVKFMEEAFDWQIMAYVFYPYYWAYPSEWPLLTRETSRADYIFQSFLQSGMSNVTVPVRPGYETAVLYFLDTGKLLENKPIIPGNLFQPYADIIGQMQLSVPKVVGSPWHTRVPTALTIIQKNAGGLEGDGLPCDGAFNDLGGVCKAEKAIATGKSILNNTKTCECEKCCDPKNEKCEKCDPSKDKDCPKCGWKKK